MTKLLTLKEMKKKLVLLTLILIALLLSGCVHTHEYELAYDDNNHQMICRCGKITEREPHKFKWIVDKEATESEDGLTHKECEKCKAVSQENTVISTFDCKPVYEDWYVDGDMQPKPPLFDYQIYVEKNRYSYEQEFEIHINNIIPYFSYANALLAGEFSIRLEESPYYEIIGQNEYLVSEFNPTDVDRLNFTFKIKATYPCDSPEYFVFKIKCPYDKEMVEKKFPYPENVNCNFDEEYFFTIKDLLYINDHNGMTIGGFEDLYRRESNISNHHCSENDVNLVLESDVVAVGSEIDLLIYTTLCKDDVVINTELQEGFSVSSPIDFENGIISLSIVSDNLNKYPRFTLQISQEEGQSFNCQVNLYGFVYEELIYLSPWSYNEAFNVFLSKNQNTNKIGTPMLTHIAIADSLIPTTNDLNGAYYFSNDIVNVSGHLEWTDNNNTTHPLRYCKVELHNNALGGILMSTFTDSSGNFEFEYTFASDADSSLFIRVIPAGEDIEVIKGDGTPYYDDIVLQDEESPNNYFLAKTYAMTDSKNNPILFSNALQIAESAIYASRYYKTMKWADISSVSIRYPHNENSSSTFYRRSTKTIYIVGDYLTSNNLKSYESWDVIMHEYGHHVAFEECITDSPGGTHFLETPMSEHYRMHFDPSISLDCTKCAFATGYYTINECKNKGLALAWSEGFATFFSMASQEYALQVLSMESVYTVGDGKYSAYNLNRDYDVKYYQGISADDESTVQAILYDMFDTLSEEDCDELSLWHRKIWNLLLACKAKTFYEFDNYFRNYYDDINDLLAYQDLLFYHNLAPSHVEALNVLTENCPTFSWTWETHNDVLYYNNYSFKLQFYDHKHDFIGGSIEITDHNAITIDEELWQEIKNSGFMFYVSVVITENSNTITSFEGKRSGFDIPVRDISVDSIYNGTLSTGNYYWYKFTAPQTGEYMFQTTGNTNTVCQIFDQVVLGQSVAGLMGHYDDGGENGNFAFTRYMSEGDTIYLRIRGEGWESTGTFVFTITLIPHEHNYTHHYLPNGLRNHYSYCACGEYIRESHHIYTNGLKNYCKECGYVTTGGPVLEPTNIHQEHYTTVDDEKDYLE